jgi:hypothetical protein
MGRMTVTHTSYDTLTGRLDVSLASGQHFVVIAKVGETLKIRAPTAPDTPAPTLTPRLYCLMAMTPGDARPTMMGLRFQDWTDLFPVRLGERDGVSYYETLGIGPLARGPKWLFWIERADQPAWRATPSSATASPRGPV